MVTDLHIMMGERLQLFLRKNRALPERVLVYRDGVSEGQFNTVINEELPLMKEAFRKFDKPGRMYNPLLTIVICVSCSLLSCRIET